MTTETVGLAQIFIVVFLSSLFSIGGGNGATAVIQDRWVGHGLLDAGLFSWSIALSYLSPGPKCGFLAAVGYYMYGVPGACAAILGIAIPTCFGAAAVSYAFRKIEPVIKFIALPACFVVAGMIAAAAWDMAAPMHLNAYEIAAIVAIAVLVGWRNLDPVIVVLGSAAAGLGWWYFTKI
ncbi:MAG TPA: chromate transporter [Herbaspirillum sp.]|jgi:chromate transporter